MLGDAVNTFVTARRPDPAPSSSALKTRFAARHARLACGLLRGHVLLPRRGLEESAHFPHVGDGAGFVSRYRQCSPFVCTSSSSRRREPMLTPHGRSSKQPFCRQCLPVAADCPVRDCTCDRSVAAYDVSLFPRPLLPHYLLSLLDSILCSCIKSPGP